MCHNPRFRFRGFYAFDDGEPVKEFHRAEREGERGRRERERKFLLFVVKLVSQSSEARNCAFDLVKNYGLQRGKLETRSKMVYVTSIDYRRDASFVKSW